MSEVACHPAAVRRKRRSTDEVRQRILEAATAEFKEKGYDKSTTTSIAKRADVIEAQVYNHFQSKATLFKNVIFEPLNQDLKRLLEADQEKGGAERYEDLPSAEVAYTQRLQDFLEANLDLLKSALVAAAYGAFDPNPIDALTEYFEHGTAMMTSRLVSEAQVDPRIMVRISFAAVLGCTIFKRWLFPEGMLADETIAIAVNDFIREGLSANHPAYAFEPREQSAEPQAATAG